MRNLIRLTISQCYCIRFLAYIPSKQSKLKKVDDCEKQDVRFFNDSKWNNSKESPAFLTDAARNTYVSPNVAPRYKNIDILIKQENKFSSRVLRVLMALTARIFPGSNNPLYRWFSNLYNQCLLPWRGLSQEEYESALPSKKEALSNDVDNS